MIFIPLKHVFTPSMWNNNSMTQNGAEEVIESFGKTDSDRMKLFSVRLESMRYSGDWRVEFEWLQRNDTTLIHLPSIVCCDLTFTRKCRFSFLLFLHMSCRVSRIRRIWETPRLRCVQPCRGKFEYSTGEKTLTISWMDFEIVVFWFDQRNLLDSTFTRPTLMELSLYAKQG